MQAQEILNSVVLVAVATAVNVSFSVQLTTVCSVRMPVVAIVLPPHSIALRHIVFTISVTLISAEPVIGNRQRRVGFC